MKETIAHVSRELGITREDAVHLLASILDLPYHRVYIDKAPDAQHAENIDRCIAQLKSGMPVEYITGQVQFLDFTLRIHPGVFIPRIETEFLIQLIKDHVPREPRTILEIGTGTGAIAIALAHTFPRARIVATDISSQALMCASENIKTYQLDDRISIVQCDLYRGLNSRFDIIVSNPPYICDARFRTLPRSVLGFEPSSALRGGHHGIDILKPIILQADEYLLAPGLVALEIDDNQPKALEELLHRQCFSSFFFLKDIFNRFRYAIIEKQSYEESENNH